MARGKEKRGSRYKKRSAESTKKRQTQGGNNFDRMTDEKYVYFKPRNNDNIIRVLPPTWDDPEHCGLDIWMHGNIGTNGNTYLCPKEMKGEDCPICEEREIAIGDNDEEYSKQLKPGKRVLHWIIDRDDEKSGPILWSMPWTIDKNFAVLSSDKKTGEILSYDDPDDGYDLEFVRTGTGRNTRYVGEQIARNPSDLGSKYDEWLDFAEDNPLPDILNYFSYDHLKKALSGGINNRFDDKDKKDEEDKKEGSSDKGSSNRRRSKKALTEESILDMGPDELDDLVEKKGLDIEPDEFDSDEEYAEEIIKELGLGSEEEPEEEEEKPTRSRRSRRDKEEPEEEEPEEEEKPTRSRRSRRDKEEEPEEEEEKPTRSRRSRRDKEEEPEEKPRGEKSERMRRKVNR